jgi:putative flavoprotein involved in K+ transport
MSSDDGVVGDVEILVVGAGQAGLATAHHLAKGAVRFAVLEAGEQAGGSWLRRWDSLTLFTPARFSSLPGRGLPGDPDRYPTRTEIADYLRDYASAFPVTYSTGVERVEPVDGRFHVATDKGRWTASAVVVATGAFQVASVPTFTADLSDSVFQVHTSGYTHPVQVPPGRVLVVGAGNSGLQVAAELSASHEVHLAVGSKQMPLPRRVLGKDIFWWLDRLGFTRAPLEKMPKWLAGDGDVLIGQSVEKTAARTGLTVHPRATAASGGSVSFVDGSTLDVDAVVWATGYRPDYRWLPEAVVDGSGAPVHRRGVTPIDGIYFVGLENQYSSASSLIGWVERDAGFIAAQATTRCGAVGASAHPA